MSSYLKRHDQTQVRALWQDFADHPDLFDMPELLRRVTALVPCDYSSSSEIDELHGRAASHYLPQDATDDADYQAFSWHVHEHPMLRRVRRTDNGGPHRLSDVVSQRQWHGLGLYNEFFRWTHVEHQVAFTANDPRAPAATAIAFNRSSHDFDDRDMAVFRAARPMFQMLQRVTGEQRRAAAAELARTQPSGSGLTVVGPVGHVESTDDVSTEAATMAFGAPLELGGLLPEDLLHWLAGPAPTRELTTPGGEVVMVHRGPSLGDRATMLLEIQHQQPTVALTAREQEVLALVAEGLSNQQVARRLGIRPRTVEKHLEHAYLKLGVDNRTAAVRRNGATAQ